MLKDTWIKEPLTRSQLKHIGAEIKEKYPQYTPGWFRYQLEYVDGWEAKIVIWWDGKLIGEAYLPYKHMWEYLRTLNCNHFQVEDIKLYTKEELKRKEME